ncbi:alpha/beta fold hydrolase [Tsukamurella spumae]|uniref:Alpha/beta fold hydrolase n=1 Tax=Tsukamurella spumae TaxID=44753 RepID=A0A846X2F8_9ACTN|nr:alpha/beta fold hydrolase [Tsukamurella spumae]NKY18090.1 alpha/beta fold hydrolase [Tsukamurella spumae]
MDDIATAYDAVVRDWGVPVRRVTVDGARARTRVLTCGPDDAPPLLCLPGGGDTAAVWFAQAAELARRFRVIAPDLPGDAGGSERLGLRTRDDLPGWVDEVLDGVGAGEVRVLAHSYGAQIAVAHAVARPGRVVGLTLLDPTGVLVPLKPTTVLRALPLLAAPSGGRLRAYRRWETRGHWPPNPAFGELAERAAGGPRPRLLVPKRPRPVDLDALRGLPGGVTVVVALRSRYHDGAALARTVERRYPWMRVETLPVSHHELPFAYRP